MQSRRKDVACGYNVIAQRAFEQETEENVRLGDVCCRTRTWEHRRRRAFELKYDVSVAEAEKSLGKEELAMSAWKIRLTGVILRNESTAEACSVW